MVRNDFTLYIKKLERVQLGDTLTSLQGMNEGIIFRFIGNVEVFTQGKNATSLVSQETDDDFKENRFSSFKQCRLTSLARGYALHIYNVV